MKLKTSFSDLTPFRKNITRFAPVWALYTVLMMLVLFAMGASERYYDHFAYDFVKNLVTAFGIINLGYAAICAMVLFGDLFNTRMCYSLHALPQRRETWFVSHVGAGLLFSLVPNILAALYMMLVLEDYWFLSLYWLLAVTLQFVFFFGVAAVSALATGSRKGMVTVYALINFLSMILYAAVEVLYLPMLEGVQIAASRFTRFSPVVHLMSLSYFLFTREKIEIAKPLNPDFYNDFMGDYTRNFYRFDGLGEGWGYLAILGVVGLLLLGLALVLYRRRRLEAAGDFVAFQILKPVLGTVLTVCCGLVFTMMGWLFHEEASLIWMAVGVAVGHFCGLMLLERRLKVFRKNTVLAFIAIALVMLLSFFAIDGDWFGIERWTPVEGNVKSVTISNGYGWSEGSFGSTKITLTDPEDIHQIVIAHQDIVDRMGRRQDSYHNINLVYQMKDGRQIVRAYTAPANGVNYEIFSRYFNAPEHVLGLGQMSWDALLDGLLLVTCDYQEIPSELYGRVMTAVRNACEQGHVSTQNVFVETPHTVEFYAEDANGVEVDRSLYISSEAKELNQLLESAWVAMGYYDWDSFLSRIEQIEVSGQTVEPAHFQRIMEAIRQDVLEGNLENGKFNSQDTIVWLYYHMRDVDNTVIFREFSLDKTCENTLDVLADLGYLAFFDD